MCILLLSVLFACASAQSNYVSFWVQPEITYGEMVYINCKLTDAGKPEFVVVDSIELYRQRRNESNMRMVIKAKYTSTTTPEDVEWFDSHLEERGKVTGSLGPPDTSIFRLRIENIDCTDGGTYKCVIRDESASGKEAERTRTTTVETNSAGVYPITTTYVSGSHNSDVSQTAVFAALRDITYTSSTNYPPGSVGLFKCQTSPGYPAPKLRWCIKRPGSSTFQSFHFMSVHNTYQANATSAAQACLLSTSSLLLFPITTGDNGTVLSCSVADEECGTEPTNPPISNNNNTPVFSSDIVQNRGEILPERTIEVYIGEDTTHIGVNAEVNRAEDKVNTNSEDSTMVVLGIAITVMMTGVILLTVAVVTYLKAKRNKEIGKIKTAGSQYTELDTPRGIHNVHSGVYDAIENLPPDIPATGKPFEVDDVYMIPVE